MVLYEGVVAKGDNGKYLTRFGNWVELSSASLFNRERLAAAIASMRDPGPFGGRLLLFPAAKEDNKPPQLTAGESPISSLTFPPTLPLGSRSSYDNGTMVPALLQAEEPPTADPSQRTPTSF